MQHCCKFKPADIYYLRENNLFSSRHLAIGFCPRCEKPVAEPYGWAYGINKQIKSKKREIIRQYACDFYGNKELIKTY